MRQGAVCYCSNVVNWIPLISQSSTGSSVLPILNAMAHDETPPTHFTTNAFTQSYQVWIFYIEMREVSKIIQNIVDAYGVADYKELNPGTSQLENTSIPSILKPLGASSPSRSSLHACMPMSDMVILSRFLQFLKTEYSNITIIICRRYLKIPPPPSS